MSYPKNQQRATIAIPATATQELEDELVAKYTTYFTGVFTKELLVAFSTPCFSTVMNITNKDGKKLEHLLGSDNAKAATNLILTALLTGSPHI